MIFDIQTIFNFYSMPLFYAVLMWIAIVGFFMQACILMIFSHLKFKTIYMSLLQIHLQSLVVGFVGAPLMAIWICWLAGFFYGAFSQSFMAIQLFISMLMLMSLYSRHKLCSIFVETSCKKIQRALGVAVFIFALNVIYIVGIVGLIKL